MSTTTKTEMIENAARLLRNKENAQIRTYGSAATVSLELAVAWTELARVAGAELVENTK